MVHLSRSTHSKYGLPIKNTCSVIFDEFLDLDPYCTSSQLSKRPDAPISGIEQTAASASSEESSSSFTIKQSRNLYRLVAMIVHLGTHGYGHYITYRRLSQAQNYLWFRISDETVRQCSVDEVLDANPFILFYERVHSAEVMTDSNHAATTFHARTIHRSELPN